MKLDKNELNLKKIATLINAVLQPKETILKDKSFTNRYDHSEDYGIYEGEKLRSYLMSNIFSCRVFTQRTQMAALRYLTLSKTADQDLVELLKQLFDDLKEKKVPYANVISNKTADFSKDGFEETVYKKIYTFDHSLVKNIAIPKDGKVKTGKWTDLVLQNGAAQLYEVPLHTTNERDTLNRPFWWWNTIDYLHPGQKLAVYFGRVGLPQSYMFYETKGHSIIVNELYGMTGESLQGMLGYLANVGNEQTKYHIEMPAESKLQDFFDDEKNLQIELKPFTMSRIIDFKKILSCMKLQNTDSLIIKVTKDDLCPWNVGNWKIAKNDQTFAVERTEEDAAFSGSIKGWTKVLLGDLTIKDAILLGKIQGDVKNPAKFEKGTITFHDSF